MQLRQSYSAAEMYGDNYGYRSGLNPSMVRHLEGKVSAILARGVLHHGDIVLDIGSNDATTLRAFPSGAYDLIGFDPTGHKFAAHYPSHVGLVPDFFSALRFYETTDFRRARVITSFSMFYDLEDPVAFVREIADCLEPDGLWVFEQSYLPAMLETNSFDTICHEHLEFYAFRQIEWILERAGMRALDVELNDVNGGSISVVADRPESGRQPETARLDALRVAEAALALDTEAPYAAFRRRVGEAQVALMAFLHKAARNGRIVKGIGASTKGNVLLQYFGIDASLVTEIGEVNPEKFGAVTPGTAIPLVSEDAVLASNPDYLLVLPWHFRRFFESSPKFRGRRLVFPLPQFEVLDL